MPIRRILTSTGPGGDVPGATSDAREQVLVRYTEGYVVTDQAFKFFSVTAKIYDLDNNPDGVYEAEYQLTAPPSEILLRPPQPLGPFNMPAPPVAHVTINAYTKGQWRFRDGSSIQAIGTANFHAVMRSASNASAGAILWVTGNQIITGGTGLYDGVQGLKILSGSADLPALPAPAAMQFPARTVDAFRIVLSEYISPF